MAPAPNDRNSRESRRAPIAGAPAVGVNWGWHSVTSGWHDTGAEREEEGTHARELMSRAQVPPDDAVGLLLTSRVVASNRRARRSAVIGGGALRGLGDQTGDSWNQIGEWLVRLDNLRSAA